MSAILSIKEQKKKIQELYQKLSPETKKASKPVSK